MKYIKIAQTAEFDKVNKKKITLNGIDILLTKVENMYYATDNKCPHMGGSLYEGNLEGSKIICPKHGSSFDVTTGKVVESGKLLFIKVKVHDLQTYPIQVTGTDISIGIE